MKEKVIIFFHWIVVFFAWSSFLWLDYKWLLLGIGIYWLQFVIFGSCILSIAQFKNKETVFMGIYINKLFRKLKIKELTIHQQQVFMRFIMPGVILGLALFFQVILSFDAFIG